MFSGAGEGWVAEGEDADVKSRSKRWLIAIAVGTLLAALAPVERAVAHHGEPGKACQSYGRAKEKNPHCDSNGNGVPNGAERDSARRSSPGGAARRFDCGHEAADPNDCDNDGVVNERDNCPKVSNFDQADADEDDEGDVCDSDRDGDGLHNDAENCPDAWNPDQTNSDRDDLGDACDFDANGNDVPDDIDEARKAVEREVRSARRQAAAAASLSAILRALIGLRAPQRVTVSVGLNGATSAS